VAGIFRQNWPFSKVLIVWGAKVQVLVVWKAIRKNSGNLGAKLYFYLFSLHHFKIFFLKKIT
jgi:hypothetical protein